MEVSNPSTRWNLNNLLYGPDIDSFNHYLFSIKEKLIEMEVKSKTSTLGDEELMFISQTIKKIESAESLYYCLTTENIAPSLLTALNGTISALKSQVRIIVSNVQDNLSSMSENQLKDWSSHISEINFIDELLKDVKNTSREEKLTSNLVRETLSGLEDLYGQVRNNLKVKVSSDFKANEVSFTEASHLSVTHPEQSKRQYIFRELNKTLETEGNIFASIYNQMVGIRLNENKIRRVDYLDESLKLNGISKPTLDVMWDVVDANVHNLSSYLRIKAAEVGKKKISWYELMTSSTEVPLQLTFLQAIDGIIHSLEYIDSHMCEFVKGAITKGWVDAEQRKTKPPGGFCAPFISEGESRVSLNYDDSMDNARRLAHELGHAWHFQQMSDRPSLRFSDDTFEMTMAETSSIFFETAFIDYIIQNIKEASIKKALLGSKIERSLNYLMSIRGAFLFENRFYEYRKHKRLDTKQMEELSLHFQEEAYGSSLSEYEPYVWIKYGQFYQANTPFYNYPYSFGFLLSIGLLELAKTDGQFDQRFKGFLSETGMLPLEQLMKKHFDIELSQPELWQQSVQRLIQDIELYKQSLGK